MRGTQLVVSCVGSSLLTVGLLTLLGFGPLNPPAGPVMPTGATIDAVMARLQTIESATGGVRLPGAVYANGGAATLTGADGAVTLPLLGYQAAYEPMTPHESTSSHDIMYARETIVTLVFEAGRLGGAVSQRIIGSQGRFQILVQGSDGSVVSSVPNTYEIRSRRIANLPGVAGNQAVEILELMQQGQPTTLTDPSGTGNF